MADRIRYRWSGSAWEPIAQFAEQVKAFACGQFEELEVVEERSKETHSHYFLCIREVWRNLPEHLVDRFGTDEREGTEALRKWLLIKSGFRDQRTIVAATKKQAQDIAASAQWLDRHVVVLIEGCIITLFRARTQRMMKSGEDGMDKKDFAASKEATLREGAHMIGVDVATLSEMGKASQ
jgi:hypothetical protein